MFGRILGRADFHGRDRSVTVSPRCLELPPNTWRLLSMGDHRAARRGSGQRRPVSTPPPLELAARPGKRRASKHSPSRGPLFRTLPSIPVLIGVTALAVATTGAVTASGQQLVSMSG